jgi:diadenosine tetraphosphate (Ap4A) HIT family hydrolase
MKFQLDPRLQNDCYLLAESDNSHWLLLNNSYFPWFIIVPKTTQTELYLLPKKQQEQLQLESNLISEFVINHFNCDKLNVASIGNIVKQMHVHIIARNESDPCWPGVVWGTNHKQHYTLGAALEIQINLKQFCLHSGINEFQFAPLQ